MDIEALISEALAARKNSYVPYSHFAVGAALLSSDGTIWRGCNIESASYSPTNCAERTAFFSAVSAGIRNFDAIAIVGGPEGAAPHDLCYPCGVCRQVMAEFCDPKSFRIIVAIDKNDYKEYSLCEMLPFAFTPSDLQI